MKELKKFRKQMNSFLDTEKKGLARNKRGLARLKSNTKKTSDFKKVLKRKIKKEG